MQNCQEIMTKNPTCCLADDKVYAVAQKMQTENIGALPVVDSHTSKKLIGIVTDRDLMIKVVGASRDATSTLVRDVMTPTPAVCRPTDAIEGLMDVMASHQIRRMPVVDTKGQIVGIISQADIATRLNSDAKTGEMLGKISQPS